MAIQAFMPEMQTPPTPARQWVYRTTLLLIALLTLATVVITHGITIGEFSYHVDESQHAATGLFYADVARELPIRHPVQYTYRYYAQYPALSGVVHWPPFFYFFEGLSFLLLGPTVVAARLSILVFALAGVSFWFLLVRKILDDWAAALGALLLVLLPSLLLFEKAVMLETPSLCLCLAATYFWAQYLLGEKPVHLYWFGLMASFALLTKQTCIYLIPFCVISGLWLQGRRLLRRRELWIMMALCTLLVAPYYVLVYLVHWKTIAMDLGQVHPSLRNQWLFYPRALPGQLGRTLLALAVLGLGVSRKWSSPKVTVLMLSWILACYITLTMIGHKEPRYAIYWLPPFIYFATGILSSFFRQRGLRIAAAGIAIFLATHAVVSGWSFQRPYVSGYSTAAKQITTTGKAGVILYDGDLPANFIFFVRANDPQKQFLVLRKALYTANFHVRGTLELVHSEKDIGDLIQTDGVRYVVVSNGLPLYFKSQELLRSVLQQPAFHRIGSFPIVGNDQRVPNSTLDVYQNMLWTPPKPGTLRIRMLTLDHDIVVPIDGSGALAPIQ